MNYIKDALTSVRQRHRVQTLVAELVRLRCSRADLLQEAVAYADAYAEPMLRMLRAHMLYTTPEAAYGALLLLEKLVSACSYTFHLALARYWPLHERLMTLAVRRAEGAAARSAQRLARLTLLEYSRTFADQAELAPLARLAGVFEQRTHRSLMRCLNVQMRRVRFREPGLGDVVHLGDHDKNDTSTSTSSNSNSGQHHNSGSGSSTSTSSSSSSNGKDSLLRGALASSSSSSPLVPFHVLSAAVEVWPCRVCGYLNSPLARRCAACETTRCVKTADPAAVVASTAAATATAAAAATAKATTRVASSAAASSPLHTGHHSDHDDHDDDDDDNAQRHVGSNGDIVNNTTTATTNNDNHNADVDVAAGRRAMSHNDDDDNDAYEHYSKLAVLTGALQHDARLADVDTDEEPYAHDDADAAVAENAAVHSDNIADDARAARTHDEPATVLTMATPAAEVASTTAAATHESPHDTCAVHVS